MQKRSIHTQDPVAGVQDLIASWVKVKGKCVMPGHAHHLSLTCVGCRVIKMQKRQTAMRAQHNILCTYTRTHAIAHARTDARTHAHG